MYKVVKAFAGIEKGEEINISKSNVKHMIDNGYVEEIKAEKPSRNKAVTSKKNK